MFAMINIMNKNKKEFFKIVKKYKYFYKKVIYFLKRIKSCSFMVSKK